MTQHSPEPPPEESELDDPHPHQAGSDEADRDKEATPGGVARELEEMADETGATTPPATATESTEPDS
jgi:hypothetical protein